jgi:hypothetical protein
MIMLNVMFWQSLGKVIVKSLPENPCKREIENVHG